ncbi:hypothetical protein PUN28_002528 [Cardiocondyla obscurior]|uniref:Uncharacterized protein n=1 Tax=Cardiocondyla obscurior TaxID=286306 RepID=A0AAW2GUN9_9HYME
MRHDDSDKSRVDTISRRDIARFKIPAKSAARLIALARRKNGPRITHYKRIYVCAYTSRVVVDKCPTADSARQTTPSLIFRRAEGYPRCTSA